jgi:membrane protease YdiL (CAAX protease family)
MRHGLVVLGFVGLWMALGWLLGLDANAYLLLGVPLTVAFQLGVARQPLRALWVRPAQPFRPTPAWIVVTLALVGLPAYELASARLAGGVAVALWYAAAIAGAPAAAYALTRLDRRAWRALAVAGSMFVVIAAAMIAGTAYLRGIAFTPATVLQGLRWCLLYFTVCFVIEEVTFRGALDSFAQLARAPGWLSASFVAVLWGLWHLPVMPGSAALLPAVLSLALLHLVVGLGLAYAWRIGGNLAVPAAAHALLDAVRNVIQLSPPG